MTGKCCQCGERYALTSAGVVATHGPSLYKHDPGCKGGGKPPKPATIKR